ncbi:protein-tyrosine phosphatase domain-containing protein [Ditylenchus destructor]|nr:protein-tyrosine phosphatase domain-containing protein [Ditylenchus destructor]
MPKSENAKSRKLTQYHFTQWPDLGVPEDYNLFLEFMRDVQKASKNSSSRILVHCSQKVEFSGGTVGSLLQSSVIEQREASASASSYKVVVKALPQRHMCGNMEMLSVKIHSLHSLLDVSTFGLFIVGTFDPEVDSHSDISTFSFQPLQGVSSSDETPRMKHPQE